MNINWAERYRQVLLGSIDIPGGHYGAPTWAWISSPSPTHACPARVRWAASGV